MNGDVDVERRGTEKEVDRWAVWFFDVGRFFKYTWGNTSRSFATSLLDGAALKSPHKIKGPFLAEDCKMSATSMACRRRTADIDQSLLAAR